MTTEAEMTAQGKSIAKRDAALQAIFDEFGDAAYRSAVAKMDADLQGTPGSYRHHYEAQHAEHALLVLRDHRLVGTTKGGV